MAWFRPATAASRSVSEKGAAATAAAWPPAWQPRRRPAPRRCAVARFSASTAAFFLSVCAVTSASGAARAGDQWRYSAELGGEEDKLRVRRQVLHERQLGVRVEGRLAHRDAHPPPRVEQLGHGPAERENRACGLHGPEQGGWNRFRHEADGDVSALGAYRHERRLAVFRRSKRSFHGNSPSINDHVHSRRIKSELTLPDGRRTDPLSAWPRAVSEPVSAAGHSPLRLTARKRRRIV